MTEQTLPDAGNEGSATGPIEEADEAGLGRQCTQAQLRRFIKSRAYIPMHELRRRFELNGAADEMTAIRYEARLVFIGLPEREAQMIGDLVRQGEVGVELSRDPDAAVAVGVFAMRPVLRT
jgi:hypothetical protein